MKYCPHCGKKISEYALSCPFCGSGITAQKQCGNEAIRHSKKILAVNSNKDIITRVTLATVVSFVVPLIWAWITAQFYDAYGENIQSVFLANWQTSVVKCLAVLIGSGIVYFVVIKLSARTNLAAFALIMTVAVVLSILHFLVLDAIADTVRNMMARLYIPHQSLRVFALVYGSGTSILQGVLCGFSIQSKNIGEGIVIISTLFLAVSVLGSFIGLLVLQQGFMYGTVYALFGAVAAVIAAVIILRK